MTLRERAIKAMAHRACPLIRPWLDGPDVKASPCQGCRIQTTPYGQGKPLCLIVAEDIATAALDALTALLRAEDCKVVAREPSDVMRRAYWNHRVDATNVWRPDVKWRAMHDAGMDALDEQEGRT